MKIPASPPASASRIRTVIIDAEPAARRNARRLLHADPEIEIVGEAGSCAEAVALIRRERPALAFLDVPLPGGDGFATLAQLGDAAPASVFVTAGREHALRAFEVNAVDCLLKPCDDARFRAALERAKRAVQRQRGEASDARLNRIVHALETGGRPAGASGRVAVKTAGEIVVLQDDEIDWVEADGDYVRFHVSGRSYLMRETMTQLEARLDARQFVRIHRSAIMNIDRLQKLSPTFGGGYAVILRDGTKLKLGRGYQERLAALLR